MARICILGGGFGGLAATARLRDLLGGGHEISLVDRSDQFYMGFAKLWALAGMRPLEEGTRSLRQLERLGVEYVQAEVTAIDAANRRVETTSGPFESDALLVALGAGPSPEHAAMLDGAGAHDLYAGEAVPAMRRDLDDLEAGRVVVAILGGPHKCPPAPYEAALIVDDLLRRRGVRGDVEVAMTTPKSMTLPVAGPDASRYVADHLEDHDVRLLADHVVADVQGAERRIEFADGSTLDYDILLGVPANVPPAVVRDSSLVGGSGFVEPDRHTLRTGFEGVYAVGDCTMIPTANGQLPKAGVFAAAEAAVAAANIAADLGVGEGAQFDGHGYCFLELPGEQVAFVEGDFYADPPEVELTPADHAQFERKQAYEAERLDEWLG